jgi:GMP synthase (glutamine-hydrolysing)
MLLLVDNTIDGQGLSPGEIHEALGRIRPDLEVRRERFLDVSPQSVAAWSPSHIILSGQSHPWADYSAESLARINRVIHESPLPILGICGGHQQIALTYGSTVDIMKRVSPGVGYEGCVKERGFAPITHNGQGILAGLPDTFTVWHSHYEEVKELPPDFDRTAWSNDCAIQAMQHRTRPLFGVQFHPELFDAENPVGQRLVENFLDL